MIGRSAWQIAWPKNHLGIAQTNIPLTIIYLTDSFTYIHAVASLSEQESKNGVRTVKVQHGHINDVLVSSCSRTTP